jgi:transposase
MHEMDRLLAQVDSELQRQSLQAPWKEPMPFLLQLPGFAVVNSLTLLAAIGDITRFPSAQKLVGYSGLGASVHASGQTYETGRITKQGRRELRSALVEAAWMAVQYHPAWRDRFEKLATRIGKVKAIVSIARKLLVVVWHVLTERAADRNALADAVARKFVRWGKSAGKQQRQGHTVAAFARGQLDLVQVGQQLATVAYGGKTFRLPLSVPHASSA